MKTPEQWEKSINFHYGTTEIARLFRQAVDEAEAELKQQLAGANAQLADCRQREAACYAALGAQASDVALPMLIERRMREAKEIVRGLVECLNRVGGSIFNDGSDIRARKRANEFLSLVTGV